MAKKKTRRDTAEIARDIVERATGSKLSGGDLPADPASEQPDEDAQGRKGGRAGGKARAESLTPEQRHEIAKKAAVTRWKGG